jgi:glycogen operon protein
MEIIDPVSHYTITSGRSYPLGATHQSTSAERHPSGKDVSGTNFALFSANADKVELCIFDSNGEHEIQRLTLPEYSDDVFHGYVEGLAVGTLYGYRVYGPFEPHNGHRFNSAKLLLDPYAKAFYGAVKNSELHYAYDTQSNQQDLTLDARDNAQEMPKCVVTDNISAAEHCQTHPQVRQRDTIIYELHVKGFTAQHPHVPLALKGTFAGLANEQVMQHLIDLGVTSIELMPVHQFLNEAFIEEKNLSNYWGYNSISFFALHAQYCHGDGITEFRAMVEAFHAHGIEVILDVVYNHSGEGNELGPTLSYKGIDNASYYRLQTQDKRFYENYSGCGNTLNIQHPRVMQLVMDSLRYWVQVMGVDGFRFDLAPILGRETSHFNANNAFFLALKQDPVLAQTKLIAEPWDVGQGGYQLGCFGKNWLEWNDQFRDTCRRFWRGDQAMVPEFARRLHGSSDIFERPSRRPSASINFITSHDGFTLQDLVSYQTPNNLANGENNRDGHNSNFSCNFGCEGNSENNTINRLRARQKRNLLTTLFIAQGTPMLLAGDEMANSQNGNNNAYCQDNEISWLNWQQGTSDNECSATQANELAFVKQLIRLRKAHPLLNRSHYHHGKKISKKTGLKDIDWLNCRGEYMQETDWHDIEIKCFAMLLAQTQTRSAVDNSLDSTVKRTAKSATDSSNNPTTEDDALLIVFNAHPCEINYTLPSLDGYWQQLLNTAEDFTSTASADKTSKSNLISNTLNVAAHSCVVLSYFSQNIQKNSNKLSTPNINAGTELCSEKQRET